MQMESIDQLTFSQPQPTVRPKQSQALKMWLGLLILVLTLLFFETRSKAPPDFNLFINTNDRGIGAQVVIDHRPAGVIAKSTEEAIGGGTFWATLKNGQHLIEITKPDCQSFQKQIDLHQEAYLGVDLAPLTH